MFVNAPLRNLDTKELKPLRTEFKFFCRYVDRRRNAVSFMKCQLIKNDGEICVECRKSPPKDCPAFQFEKSIGGLMFDPQPSDDLKGHFKTYLEIINYSPDDLPKYTSQQMSDLGRCSICKNWHIISTTEIQRHKRLLHTKVLLQKLLKVNPDSEVPNVFICRHKINEKECGLLFPTYHQLLKHQEKSGNKRKRAEGDKNDEDKRNKKATKDFCPKKEYQKLFSKENK